MSNPNQILRSVYSAFAAGDLPALLAHLHPEIRWNEAEGFPLADRNPYVGCDAIVQGVFVRIAEEWDDFQVEVGELAGSGDVVTVFGRYKARHKRTRKVLDVQCAHTWWLANGKLVRFQQMVDTAGVAAARA
ncbi:MAG: nuclear transport factor 2 family protein [Planctomycetes bacterium]|nr:nuclear transport factor 2 family protein [Planctomycetota bacterium]